MEPNYVPLEILGSTIFWTEVHDVKEDSIASQRINVCIANKDAQ